MLRWPIISTRTEKYIYLESLVYNYPESLEIAVHSTFGDTSS